MSYSIAGRTALVTGASNGIGLAIARRLIELMGGSLKITSEVGVGSRFSFTLPFTIGGAEHDSEPI